MEDFVLGQTVECKSGIGEITYLEDGLMEVTLKNGVEKNFWKPFSGKVWPYKAPEKPIPESENPIWETIANNPKIQPYLIGAQAYHSLIGGLLNRIGGGAGQWDNMSAFQQANVLGIYVGLPTSVLKEAAVTGRLEELFSNRSSGN